jgi:hypothetical protein
LFFTASILLPVVDGLDAIDTLVDRSLNASFTGLGDSTTPSLSAASRLRSSHLPRIVDISKLCPTRCVGLVGVLEEPDPVLLEESIERLDCGPCRDDTDPARLSEEVRSKRRVWYGRNAALAGCLELEGKLDEI